MEPMLSTVSPYPAPVTFDVEIFAQQTKASETYITKLASELTARGIETEVLIEHGRIVNSIVNVAEDQDVDLIAIASHGRTGLSRALYGSVAAALLYQVDRPLLLIRAAIEPA